MRLWTCSDASAATGGVQRGGDWTASGVSIDTRTLEPGDLFVALKDVRDGHDFVADVLARGACAALVSRVPDDVDADAPLLLVNDVLDGLTRLGKAARRRTRAQVIGVTGSAGKTSTKEMLRVILARQGRVHAAEASYNNHWGVPLTLARMPESTEFAIIEIGMNAPGEIAPLSRLARPNVAVVTTVAAAHLAAFEDLSGIACEKASIFEGLEPGGTAIVNADVGTAQILAETAERYADQVVSFGESEGTDYTLGSANMVGDSTIVRAQRGADPILFKIGVAGAHFAMNALAVLAVVDAVGADVAVAACDLGQWSPPAGRGTRETLSLDPVEDHMTIELIDDAFNANPASVSAALDVLLAAEPVDDIGRVARGRRIAIMGDMLELGPEELAMHRAIADHPAIEGIALVHCVGSRMMHLWNALPEVRRGLRVERAEDLAALAHTLVDAGDVVLVKGSKGSRVSLVVDALRKLGHPRPIKS